MASRTRFGAPWTFFGARADPSTSTASTQITRSERFRSEPPEPSPFARAVRFGCPSARWLPATRTARTAGWAAQSSERYFDRRRLMATVLERPTLSKALAPERVKGRQSAVAIPVGGYFADKVEQGRFG